MSAQAQRAQRARNGSRRKRDLDALRAEATPLVPVPADVKPDDRAATAWADALDTLRFRLPFGSVENWLDPLTVLGVAGNCIVVTGHPRNVDWTRKRYAAALSELVGPDFAGVLICDRGQA